MRPVWFSLLLVATLSSPAQQPGADAAAPSQAAPMRTEFQVRYVNGTDVYIDAGRDAGLAPGTKVVLKQSPGKVGDGSADAPVEPGVVATLTVVSVATTSAVCEVNESTRTLAVGDVLSLPDAEVQNMVAKNTMGNSRKYPMIVSFTEGDPLDEEVREEIPHPPLPEINQARLRFGFDFSTIQGLGGNGFTSTVIGTVVRANISRMWGTHWNLNGYWRGRVQSSTQPAQSSIQDLINRTYEMSLTYVNPGSPVDSRCWTAVFALGHKPRGD